MAKAKAAAKAAPRTAQASLSMADRDGWIWYDGKLVPWRAATTHVLTHSLHYGLAVFEGVRAYQTVNGTQIYRLNRDVLLDSLARFASEVDGPLRRETQLQRAPRDAI